MPDRLIEKTARIAAILASIAGSSADRLSVVGVLTMPPAAGAMVQVRTSCGRLLPFSRLWNDCSESSFSLGVADATGKIGTFLVFGLGFGLPLVLLPLVAGIRGREVVRWIVARHRAIEVVAGVALIVVGIVDLVDKWPLVTGTLGP